MRRRQRPRRSVPVESAARLYPAPGEQRLPLVAAATSPFRRPTAGGAETAVTRRSGRASRPNSLGALTRSGRIERAAASATLRLSRRYQVGAEPSDTNATGVSVGGCVWSAIASSVVGGVVRSDGGESRNPFDRLASSTSPITRPAMTSGARRDSCIHDFEGVLGILHVHQLTAAVVQESCGVTV
jgi:hypothetical protein